MHEYSIMSQVIQAILDEAGKNKLNTISKVTLEIGELTFLGEEQLRFCYEVLSKDNMRSNAQSADSKVIWNIRNQKNFISGFQNLLARNAIQKWKS